MKAPVRSRRGWRRLVAAAAVAGVVAVSAACGPGDGVDSGDGTRFTYWSMWRPTEPQGQVLQSSIDQFTRDTGITVDVRWQGRRVLDNLAPSLPQGAYADLVDQSRTKLRTVLADTGQSADMTPVLDQPIPGENKRISEVIPPKYRPFLNGRDGKPYLIPYEVTGEALWLDAAKYPDVAAKPPENWDDFVAVLARIQASGVTPIALDTNKAFWPLLVLQRALGPQDLVRSAGDRTGEAWNAPAVLDAVDRLEQLVRRGYFGHAYTDAQFPAGQIKWAQGRAALFLQGSWRLIQAPSGKCVEDESDDCRDCRFKCGVGPPVVCVENFPRFDMGDDSFDGGACVVEALVECFLPVEKFPAGWFFERGEHAAPDVSFIADRGVCGEVVEGAGLVEAI